MTDSLLFSPIDLRGIRAKNRIVLSPMCQYSGADGHPTDWHLVNLGKYAQGGAGIVMAEASAVESRGRITHGDLGLWDDAHIAGHRRITDFVRSQGAVPAVQIAHAGRKASMQRPWFGNGPLDAADADRGDRAWETVAASAVALGDGWIRPAELQPADLATMREAFAAAARRSIAAGYDVIEVHGAHGYLLNTFLSPLSNRRTDAYGGGLANRMRFPLEIAEVVRASVPDDRPVFFRVSSVDDAEGGTGLDDTITFAAELQRRGIDVVDCSTGGILGSATAAARSTLSRGPGFQIPFAERIRAAVGIKTMAVGLILTGRQAEDALREGRADLIAIGREALFNPNWPVHAALELGVDPDFTQWPAQYGWWLTRRETVLKKAGVERQGLSYAGAESRRWG